MGYFWQMFMLLTKAILTWCVKEIILWLRFILTNHLLTATTITSEGCNGERIICWGNACFHKRGNASNHATCMTARIGDMLFRFNIVFIAFTKFRKAIGPIISRSKCCGCVDNLARVIADSSHHLFGGRIRQAQEYDIRVLCNTRNDINIFTVLIGNG